MPYSLESVTVSCGKKELSFLSNWLGHREFSLDCLCGLTVVAGLRETEGGGDQRNTQSISWL